jgi:ubiquinone/menaquinone biosynthesis C-methylase UbiE
MKRKMDALTVDTVGIENYPEYLDKVVKAHHWIEQKWAAAILDFAIKNGKTDLRLLDAGCGVGILIEELLNLAPKKGISIKIVGIDKSEQMISYVKEKFSRWLTDEVMFVQGDVTQTDFPNNSFDLVVATLFFFFLDEKNLIKFFDETYRILSPGGQFCFYHTNRSRLAWLASYLTNKVRYQLDAIERSYTAAELRKLILRGFLADSVFQAKSEWFGIMTKVFGIVKKPFQTSSRLVPD